MIYPKIVLKIPAKINLYTNEWKLMKEKYAYHGSAKQIPKPILFEDSVNKAILEIKNKKARVINGIKI